MSGLKTLCMFFTFVGSLLIIIGIYEQKLAIAEKNTKVEYKFIPRTLYEEQLPEDDTRASVGYSDIFAKESPWFDRTIGPLLTNS